MIIVCLSILMLFSQYLSQSKRFMPELVNFLTSVLGYFAEDGVGMH